VSFVVTALFKPINHKGHEGPQRKKPSIQVFTD
jgi:hypothetical protein